MRSRNAQVPLTGLPRLTIDLPRGYRGGRIGGYDLRNFQVFSEDLPIGLEEDRITTVPR